MLGGGLGGLEVQVEVEFGNVGGAGRGRGLVRGSSGCGGEGDGEEGEGEDEKGQWWGSREHCWIRRRQMEYRKLSSLLTCVGKELEKSILIFVRLGHPVSLRSASR